MAFYEENQLFVGDFRAILDEKNAGIVQFTKDVVRDFLTSRILLQKACSCKCSCLCAIFQSKCWKENAIPNSSLQSLNIHKKNAEKLGSRKWIICK